MTETVVGLTPAGTTTAALSPELRAEIEAFLYLEARLADESRYDEWLALMDAEVQYWVPKGRADYDPAGRVSYINDNRRRLETRVAQLKTGVRHAQTPPSPMRRVVSNIEILTAGDDRIVVGANFVLYEHAIQASNELRIWAGRTTHHLRRVGEVAGDLRISAKTVEVVNSNGPLPTLAFLL